MTANIWESSRQIGLSNVAAIIKATDGHVGGYYVYNPAAAVTYLQFYDSTASIAPGTDAAKLSFGIPGGAAAHIEFNHSLPFAAGIQIAATTTAAGGSAPASGLDCNIFYK